MFKKYWIEILTSLGMTVLLITSFGSSPRTGPDSSPTKARSRDYLLVDHTPFLEGEYKAAPSSKQVDWNCQIWADGRVLQGEGANRHELHLSEEQLKSLVSRLRRENALDLGQRLPREPGDGPSLGLRIRLQGGEVGLKLVFTRKAREFSEGRRFLRIWADLLTEVPSPNGEKPIDYLGPAASATP